MILCFLRYAFTSRVCFCSHWIIIWFFSFFLNNYFNSWSILNYSGTESHFTLRFSLLWLKWLCLSRTLDAPTANCKFFLSLEYSCSSISFQKSIIWHCGCLLGGWLYVLLDLQWCCSRNISYHNTWYLLIRLEVWLAECHILLLQHRFHRHLRDCLVCRCIDRVSSDQTFNLVFWKLFFLNLRLISIW